MTLVVDASVAVKWILPEPGSTATAALRRQDMELIAPSLVIAEIGNALWKKVLRGEIEGGDALAAMRIAAAQLSEVMPLGQLAATAIKLAIDLRHPIYDCFYIALAQRESATLVTADEDMIAAARSAKIKVRRL